MRRLLLVALLVPGLALADVVVNYEEPEKFADFKLTYAPHKGELAMLTSQLTRHIKAEATPLIGPKARLEIWITDIDMAGAFQNTAGGQSASVRMIAENSYPRIDLEYRLTDGDGKLLKQVERKLRGSALLSGLNPLSSDPLKYEKALLDEWLEREFPKAVANANR